MNSLPNLPADAASSDDEVFDPDVMLQVLRAQQERTAAGLMSMTPLIMIAWGLAWLIGFAVLWLMDGLAPAFAIPPFIAYPVFTLFLAAAAVTTAVGGARMSRGVKHAPGNAFSFAAFSITAGTAFFALSMLGVALGAAGAGQELLDRYFPTTSVMVVGLMYMMAAANWRVKPALYAGGFIVLTAIVGAFSPAPTYLIIYSVFGGGMLLVYGLVTRSRVRRGLKA